jgi:CheY-like chemotaxis protein
MPIMANPILIADDDSADAERLKVLIRQCRIGNPLEVVSDGEKAIRYLKGEGSYMDRERYPLPVLFLLDLIMPRLGGLRVLEWIKSQPKLQFPTIVLIGIGEMRQMQFAYAMGAHSFLLKPLVRPDLLAVIKGLRDVEVEV